MIDSLDFESSFERIESKAKADGAEVELLVERFEKFSVSFQQGKTDKFDSSASQCAGLRVIVDGYPGYSFSENLSEPALLEAYREALENARFTARAADPSLRVELISDTAAVEEDRELFNDSLSSLSIEEKLERARVLEAGALGFDSRITAVPYNGYTEGEGEFQILTSRGVRRRQRQTSLVGYSYPLAKQGEESRSSGEMFFTRDAREFNAAEIAEKAAKKTLAKLGAEPPPTGKYAVVIDSEVASSFLGLVTDSFSAKAVSEKRSIFANDLGKPIASSKVTIVDDPFFKGGMGARRFDSEGAACRVTPLVQEGTLSNFLTNSVYAKRMKLPHTASASRSAKSELDIGISNMVVKPGAKSLEELLAAYQQVIYITDLTGFHAGYQAGSGDFSLQSEGEFWENGKRVRPLCNFVTSGNIRQLLAGIEEVGSRIAPPTGSVISPDLLVRELSIAGK